MAKKKPTKPTKSRKPITPRFCYTDGVLDHKGNPHHFTAKEKKFVAEYMNDPRHVAWIAAKAAGFGVDGTKDATFRVIASQLMAKDNVRSAINQAFESLTMPKFETLFRISTIAAGSIDDVLDTDGNFSIDVARERGSHILLKKIEIDRDVIEVKESGGDDPLERSVIKEKVKIQIHDPLRALELLGRHGKLFASNIELPGGGRVSIPEGDGTQVVFYIPDNGRGDADGEPESESKRTKKQTTRTTPKK